MPISLSFNTFPICPKCGDSSKAQLIPVYEFRGGNPQSGTLPSEIFYWKCSNPKCKLTVEP